VTVASRARRAGCDQQRQNCQNTTYGRDGRGFRPQSHRRTVLQEFCPTESSYAGSIGRPLALRRASKDVIAKEYEKAADRSALDRRAPAISPHLFVCLIPKKFHNYRRGTTARLAQDSRKAPIWRDGVTAQLLARASARPSFSVMRCPFRFRICESGVSRPPVATHGENIIPATSISFGPGHPLEESTHALIRETAAGGHARRAGLAFGRIKRVGGPCPSD
jgi:hypothetical protein